MRKKVLFIILLFFSVYMYSYDLRGVWMLNTLTPLEKKYNLKQTSWGECRLYNNEELFFIDINGNTSFIEFYRWGKIYIDEIIEKEQNNITITFSWNGYDSYIEFGIINDNEIIIKKMEASFIFPNGAKKRFFRVEGPDNNIKNPLFATLITDASLKSAGDKILGLIPKETKVVIISISNNTNYYDDIESKMVTIQVNEEFLKDFNPDIYNKQNLTREDSYVYGRVPLSSLKIVDDIQLE